VSEPFDFRYYKPLNAKQAAFHASRARHKALIGGVGAGKTFPAIHEALMVCGDNPDHIFTVWKNTWETLETNIEGAFLRISEMAHCHSPNEWSKSGHDLTLRNGTVVQFRPLGMDQEQIKGMHFCGMLIDDPDVWTYKKIIGFLFTRMRDPAWSKANYYESIITANWEGKDWTWQTYMRNRPEGEGDRFAYWLMKTSDNYTLQPDYISDLEAMHSQAWMDRYIYCDMKKAASGLVYDEYNSEYHDADLAWCGSLEAKHLIKILVVDNGSGSMGVTCVLKMATDGKEVYIYGEWYRRNVHIDELGEYLQREMQKDTYRAVLIDPTSAITERDGGSVKRDLARNYGIYCIGAENSKLYGIELVKTLLTIRDGKPAMFFDPERCPNAVREIEIYRRKDQTLSQMDEMEYKIQPVDKDDHAMDCVKYGCRYLQRFIRWIRGRDETLAAKRKTMYDERVKKLKMYQEIPGFVENLEARRLQLLHASALRRTRGVSAFYQKTLEREEALRARAGG